MITEKRLRDILEFAGEAKPSMLRRSQKHDYRQRRMYLITITTEGRRPVLGQVVGSSQAPSGAPDAPRMELSALGQAVEEAWRSIPTHYPEVSIVACQTMPDHFHGILFITTTTSYHLGQVVKGFKTGCNKAARRLMPSLFGGGPSPFTATLSRYTEKAEEEGAGKEAGAVTSKEASATASKADEPRGSAESKPVGAAASKEAAAAGSKPSGRGLWSRGYNDKILFSYEQLRRWIAYLEDNPRRLLVKRENPDLFRVQRNVTFRGQTFSALGNRLLLDRPELLQVQCSRRMTEQDIEACKRQFLAAAQHGAVLVSPSISPGEKAVMRAAFERGYPLIILQENGFTDLAKPGGKRFDACQEGRLLLLAPWEHHNEQRTITRSQCCSLNDITRSICGGGK